MEEIGKAFNNIYSVNHLFGTPFQPPLPGSLACSVEKIDREFCVNELQRHRFSINCLMKGPLMRQMKFIALASSLVFLSGLVACSPAAQANACPDNAQEYWKTWRAAAMQAETEVVANGTQFPFMVNGLLDENEKQQLARSEFKKQFPNLLKADLGLSATPSTMEALLKATPELSKSFCNANGNQFRVGAWVFHRSPEGWRFVQAFVDN